MAKGKKLGRSSTLMPPGTKELERLVAALEQSNRRFTDIAENADEWIWELDAKGKYTYASPVVKKILGYKPEEVLKKHFYDLFHPDDREKLKEAAFEVFAKKQAFRQFVNRNVHKNGKTVWLSTSGVPILDEEGNLLGYRGADVDITERRRAEEALREGEERYRALFENAYDMIQSVAPDGHLIFVNKAWLETLGYTQAELPTLNLFNIIHPESLPHCQEIFSKVMAGESVRNVQATFVTKDGRAIQVEGNATARSIGGRVIATHGIFHDITERKRAEEALSMKTTLLEVASEASIDGILAVDENDKILLSNKRFQEIWGIPQELVDAKDNKLVLRYAASLLDNPEAFIQMVYSLYDRKKGKIHEEGPLKDGRFLDVYSSPLVDDKGEHRGRIWYFRDITQRKRTEQALADEATRRRILVDQSRDGIVILDQNGKVYEANQKFAEMLGYSPEEVRELHVWDWDTQWTREQLLGMIQSVDETGDHFETYHRRKDGTVYDVEISTNGAVYGGQKLIFCVCRDITERKQAEEELKLRAQILDAATDSIFVVDYDGNFIYVNEAACREHGYSREEFMKMKLPQVIAPERVSGLDSDLKEILAKGEAVFESAHLRKDGSIMPAEVHGRSIESGGRRLFLTVIRDITERKRAEEALKEAHEQLIRSEKLAAIGQLASGVGHELRNPLAAIKNAIFYVRRRTAKSDLAATEPKLLEFLDIMDKEVDSANKVISDLLGFSRVAKPTVSPANIGSIIEDALKHVPMLENIKLATDVVPSLPTVMVDADQIRQVFVNIILNAVEAMPEGGRLEIGARSKDQFVEVEFADTGCGIPEAIISKIFDPLFTTKAKGIGLGLAMCKSILERHGGEIQVKSEEGKGAIFTASLPTQAG